MILYYLLLLNSYITFFALVNLLNLDVSAEEFAKSVTQTFAKKVGFSCPHRHTHDN